MPQKLPLEPLWKSLGAAHRVTCGWELPVSFGPVEIECAAVREAAVLFDLSWRGKLKISGSDRIPVLHNLLTSDIQQLKGGSGCYSAFLTAQGKIVADMKVYLFEDCVLIDTEAGLQQKIAERLGRFIIMEDVRMEDAASGFCHFLLAGPLTAGILEKLCGGGALPEKTFEHGERNLGGLKVTLVKSGRPGIEGYEILCGEAEGEAAARALLGEVKPAGYAAWESLRIEAGMPRYGIDMSEEDTLPETGLDFFAASETKGCYPGQEVVARTNTYKGHAKKLLGFAAGCGWIPAGSKLMSGEKEAGWITSSSPSLQGNGAVMLGYLRKGFFESRGPLKIISGENEAVVSVRTLPSSSCF